MKFKLISILALGLIVITTACAPPHKNYWKRVDANSALYLTGPKAVARLNQDISLCTNAVKKLVEINALRETMPPDTSVSSGRKGTLAYYDTPTRLGALKVSHTDFHDFKGCMLSQGWARQSYVRPQTLMKAENNYKKIKSIQKTGMTRAEKRSADAAAHKARLEALVKPGEQFSIGVQAYRDTYDEPDIAVNTSTNFYGATASYTNRDSAHYFWTVKGRIARGEASYDSPSGILNGIPEYEGDIKLTYGKDFPLENGWISPYIGLGTRIYRMQGKGLVTNLGFWAYDRRIEQLYIPIGATWRSLLGWWTISSTLEVDPLLFGRVNSRLTNGGGPNVVNKQSAFSGYGIRGEIMIGIPTKAQTIEFGPFFQYWSVRDSKLKILPPWAYWEPYNERFQYGLEARISF